MTPARIRTGEAAAMLGLTERGVQSMAQRGDLPGAAKIGKAWTFDPTKLRRFIEAKEAECQKRTCFPAKASGGFVRGLTASKSVRAYEQAILELRGKGGTRASKR